MTFTFYLGTHVLNHIEKTDSPLFISFRQLRKRKKKRFEQKVKICVDSGGFSELSMFGKWVTNPDEYIDELIRLQALGLDIEWASAQDWRVEPIMIEKTGLTIREHQKRSVENFIYLRSICDSIHIIPVLQGQTLEQYFEHFEMYEKENIQLRKEKVVGVGSVCRRQSSNEIEHIMKCLFKKGLKLHGFGVKINGLRRYQKYLISSDSLAWSYGARYSPLCDKCKIEKPSNKNCANCLNYALEWRNKVIKIGEGKSEKRKEKQN